MPPDGSAAAATEAIDRNRADWRAQAAASTATSGGADMALRAASTRSCRQAVT
jgi:hypothetical protein